MAIASGIVSAAWDVYQFLMPIYGRSLGLSATAIGLIMTGFAVSIILPKVSGFAPSEPHPTT